MRTFTLVCLGCVAGWNSPTPNGSCSRCGWRGILRGSYQVFDLRHRNRCRYCFAPIPEVDERGKVPMWCAPAHGKAASATGVPDDDVLASACLIAPNTLNIEEEGLW